MQKQLAALDSNKLALALPVTGDGHQTGQNQAMFQNVMLILAGREAGSARGTRIWKN